MRIAVAGKGGAGKTTISATLARIVARSGRSVVAIDADTNPNLAVALGFSGVDVDRTPILPTTLVSRKFDGPGLKISVAAVLAAHATVGPDGVLLVRMGMPTHAQEGCLCSAHAVGSALLGDLGDDHDRLTIMDLEASPEHLSRGTARHADRLILVAEPYFRSLETVRRQAALAAELPSTQVGVVANKVRQESDADAIRDFVAELGLPLWGLLPWSDDVCEADRAAVALVDHAPHSIVVQRIHDVAETLGVASCV